ncbi:MAG: DNA (cytosine-5-)-methyltransferase [Flavobacteriales bacterium]|nr:DNA (cytosine-5-)-methyltransferase [Flavobacteriales bacterium]
MASRDHLNVVELFAGVGGFRIGLERASDKFRVVWSNQWEPGRKKQDASEIYAARFGLQGHSNQDIATVATRDIPDHDLLVGGFPCQDYSVARTLNQAAGLTGRKGVLWWEIHRILKEKRNKPGYLLLENVDRLLKSPATQRGRDFAVMLASLADLGYAVEWRVVNAADYGMPQRRRRIFFLGIHRSTPMGNRLYNQANNLERLLATGVFAEAFPAQPQQPRPDLFTIHGDLAEVTERFNTGTAAGSTPFSNAGLMVDRRICTVPVQPLYTGPFTALGAVLQPVADVPEAYFIPPGQESRWQYLKGGKRETRTNKATGFAYQYSEGALSFPDPLDRPARTIITAEGGPTPSRFKHVVRTADGRLRRLTPVELERLNMFADGHTAGVAPGRRAFLMGNALVTGIVEKAAAVLVSRVGAAEG